MLLGRASAFLCVAVLVSRGAVDAAANRMSEEKEAVETGRRGIFGKVFGGTAEDEGAILKEDDGYWERFLQATIDSTPSVAPSVPPTASPTAHPSDPPSASPTSRPSVSPSSQPSASPSAWPSAQPSASPTAKPSAQPSASPTARPSVSPSARPSASPSASPSAQPSPSPSAAPTEAAVCEVVVRIACVSSEGVECRNIPQPDPETPSDCFESVEYTYTVSNSGLINHDIDSLRRTRNGVTVDLTGDLETTELSPGDETSVMETEVIDICQGTTFETTAFVDATTAGIVGKPCEDDALYRFNPDAPCKTQVDITCVDSQGNECKDTPEPQNPDECIEPFTYTYTVENIGPACMELTDWTATFEFDGTSELIDLLPKVPEEERNICPGQTFSVTNTVDAELCQGYTFKTTTEVMANPPNGESCQATDEYEVTPKAPCKTKVEIACVDSEGNECAETPEPVNPGDCIEPFTYTYTVENVGPTCMELTDWTAARTFGDTTETTDLLPKVPVEQRDICPGETLQVTQMELTDLCQGFTYTTTTEVMANPPNGNSCQATDGYQVTPEAPCITDVVITCENADGIECKEIPTPNEPEDCLQDVTYTYTIENTGLTCMEVTRFTRTRNEAAPTIRDLLPLIPEDERIICPVNPFYSVSETESIDICQGLTYATTVQVEANPPKGTSCQATNEYEFTPEVPCKTEVKITCSDSDGNDCTETPEPQDPEDCIEPFTYTYTVENVGPACMELTEWTMTREFDGTNETNNLLLEVPVNERNICPGETFSITEIVDTDLCKGFEYVTTTEVKANPPNGNACQATDEYVVLVKAPCDVDIEITCTDSNGLECSNTLVPTTPQECIKPFTYTYTIINIGPTCMDITSFTRDRNGETADLTPLLEGVTEICPGRGYAVSETEDTDVCLGETYTTTVDIKANPPNGDSCEATDEYAVVIEVPCNVRIAIECKNADGTECKDITVPSDPSNCLQDITYTYTITNRGPTCMEFTSWDRTRNGVTESLLDLLPPGTRLCPDDPDLVVTETVETQICTEECYKTETTIGAKPPLGESCESNAFYEFCVSVAPSAAPSAAPSPMPSSAPSEQCFVDVETECSTEAATIGGGGDCNAIIPIITRCDQRATFMEMLFNGGNCDQSFNIQEADKFDCTDFGGGPALSGSYYIHVVPRKDPNGDVYFGGFVQVGSVFPMCPGYPACTGERFEADSTVFIFDGNPGDDPVNNPTAPLVQLVNYHTSCSQNLFLKDKYGSTQLVIFFNEEQGLVSCFITATFSITVTNAGAANAAEILLFTNTVNGNTTDLTGSIQEIDPDEVIVVTTQILIDMTIRTDYIVTTEIIGATPQGTECSDSDTITFTAGNDLDVPPGLVPPGEGA